MGGMFSMLKVRRDLPAGSYKDPGWFKHPEGTVAFEYAGALAEPARVKAEGGPAMPAANRPAEDVTVRARKPRGHTGH
jgi:hypothetical protein